MRPFITGNGLTQEATAVENLEFRPEESVPASRYGSRRFGDHKHVLPDSSFAVGE